VTSGLGTSILPVRFNARPEWVLLVVGAAAG
jgi:predicted MPP superfamily phosphohydrolase